MENFSKAGGRGRLHDGRTRVPIADRLWPKVRKDGPGGCWLWAGSLNDNGYGILDVRTDGKARRFGVHRLMYELLVGPIPEGLTLDHVWERGCRFRHCVNPDHLEPVTQKENSRRASGAVMNGRRHGACFLIGTRTYVERWKMNTESCACGEVFEFSRTPANPEEAEAAGWVIDPHDPQRSDWDDFLVCPGCLAKRVP